MQEIVTGKIIQINEDGGVLIGAAVPNLDKALLRKYSTVQIGFCDGRRISPEQRRKVYALIHEISDWMGDHEESVKATMKMEFVMNRLQSMQRKLFSLSDVDMNTAAEFITYLIDFILEHDIPCQDSRLSELCEDIGKYVYSCLVNKRCAVCGLPSDLHHFGDDKIGMGNDRQDVHHLGREALPLCRVHHNEAHNVGDMAFIKQYHLQAVKLDEVLCRRYKLKK